MNRAELVQRIAAHEAAAKALRAALENEARMELEENGTAPSWRLPDGSRVEVRTSSGKLIVVDDDAFMTWVRQAYPSEVVEVTELRFRAPAFRNKLLDLMAARAIEDGWELPPFVTFTSSGEYLNTSVAIAPATKIRMQEQARLYVLAGRQMPELSTPPA